MTEDEEYARSELYGVLSMLFYGPPSQAVLDLIEGAAIEGDGVLADAWRGLQTASSTTDAERAREEYESLFIGVGKPEVMLYGSYYLSGFLMEKPLAALREDLARLGLERSEHLSESEDHIAALCDAMRLLHGSIATQKEFLRAISNPGRTSFLMQSMRIPGHVTIARSPPSRAASWQWKPRHSIWTKH